MEACETGSWSQATEPRPPRRSTNGAPSSTRRAMAMGRTNYALSSVPVGGYPRVLQSGGAVTVASGNPFVQHRAMGRRVGTGVVVESAATFGYSTNTEYYVAAGGFTPELLRARPCDHADCRQCDRLQRRLPGRSPDQHLLQRRRDRIRLFRAQRCKATGYARKAAGPTCPSGRRLTSSAMIAGPAIRSTPIRPTR